MIVAAIIAITLGVLALSAIFGLAVGGFLGSQPEASDLQMSDEEYLEYLYASSREA